MKNKYQRLFKIGDEVLVLEDFTDGSSTKTILCTKGSKGICCTDGEGSVYIIALDSNNNPTTFLCQTSNLKLLGNYLTKTKPNPKDVMPNIKYKLGDYVITLVDTKNDNGKIRVPKHTTGIVCDNDTQGFVMIETTNIDGDWEVEGYYYDEIEFAETSKIKDRLPKPMKFNIGDDVETLVEKTIRDPNCKKYKIVARKGTIGRVDYINYTWVWVNFNPPPSESHFKYKWNELKLVKSEKDKIKEIKSKKK